MFYNGDCVTFTLYGTKMVGFIETINMENEVALISVSTGHIVAATFQSLKLIKFPLMGEDYLSLLDCALDTKDETWFNQLSYEYELFQEEQYE